MTEEKQVTWGGRFTEGPSELMKWFGESVSFDWRLAPFDVAGSKAHSAMLAKMDLLTEEEKDAIHTGLDELLTEIEQGDFEWDADLEDVHMNLEHALLTKTAAAAKLHAGRSRNDQVATDMRLFFKDACVKLGEALEVVMRELLTQADRHAADPIPGYTHMQRAQPVTIGHYLLAHLESFGRDRVRFGEVFDHANVCPLGSGAIAGTTLPVDREFVARELGFVDENGEPRLTANSMDAVADRDLFLEFAGACATCGLHVSRLAEDFILWNSSEFGFVDLPDAFTTGSSLMPQKKNPDSLELLRGKSGRLVGNLQTLYVAIKGLPLTYNRDLQEDKPPVFDSYDHLGMGLAVLSGVIEGMTFQLDRCRQAASDPLLLATDLADYLVQRGVPFREAHHAVGSLVATAEQAKVELPDLPQEQAKSVCPQLGEDWREVFDLDRAFSLRDKPGMPGPGEMGKQIDRWGRILEQT
ncbi:MAG: argininosuccinate lyase [Opitutales bacterium]|jgi:argininosuccinate lyase